VRLACGYCRLEACLSRAAVTVPRDVKALCAINSEAVLDDFNAKCCP
jgi:hypothetical protein